MSITTLFLDTQSLTYQTAATVSTVDEFGNPTYTPTTSTLTFTLTELDNATARRLALTERIGSDASINYFLCACVNPNTLPNAIKEGFETAFTLNGEVGTLRVHKILETTFGIATAIFGQQFVVTFKT